MENLGKRSVVGIEDALNTILQKSLKTEGSIENKIQSLVIGFCVNQTESSNVILSAESLVEVVRRCSVCGPENNEGDEAGIGTNLTLVSALSALSKLAKKTPDKVLSSLMSVFTFMGRGLLPRADDRYSFYAIQETIKCVVPALLRKSRDHIYTIVLTFVGATPHVPVHRRGTVFESLIVTCGKSETLHIVLLALSVHHVMVSKDENIQDPSDFSELMHSLISRFSVREVIDATVRIAEYMTELKFEYKKEELRQSKLLDPEMTSPDITNLHFYLALFINRLYSSQDFLHGQLAMVTEEEEMNLNESYGSLLQYLLSYTNSARSNRALFSKANSCIERVLSLLPPIEFAQCISNLIRSAANEKQEWQLIQALEMLCARLKNQEVQENAELPEYEVDLMSKILDDIGFVIKTVKLVGPLNLAMKAVKLVLKTCSVLLQNDKAIHRLVKTLAQEKDYYVADLYDAWHSP